MKFILNEDKLEIQDEECLNSGSIKYYEAEVEHDEEWNNLTIEARIVKKEGGLIADIGTGIAVINNKIYIDKQINGSYAIGFVGYTIENEVKTYQISTNLKGLFFNKGAGELEVSNSEDIPTPTEWEQYLAQVTEFINNANTKINQAENLDIDASKENGVTTVTITKKDGTEESVDILDGEKGDTGDTGPQGPVGPQGEQGIQGIQGPMRTTGRSIYNKENLF